MAAFFVSYRRHDVPDMVGRLHDRLITRFGPGAIFRDVDSVPLGVDFREHLNEALARCKAIIVVIGPRFLERANPAAPDYVVEEITTALARSLEIFPVLVRDTEMPAVEALPSPIQKLAFLQGARLRGDPDFLSDAERLIARLKDHASAHAVETPVLELVSGPHKGIVFPLVKGQTLIGHAPDCDVRLDAAAIASVYHAAIERTEEGFFCRHLGSLNDTFVNGNRTNGRVPLRHGDLIHIGNRVLKLRIAATKGDSPPAQPLRLTVHRARFVGTGTACCFINVTNLGHDDVELTHVWIASQPPTYPDRADRPLPKRLRPQESWETWVPLSNLPAHLAEHDDLYHLARARLSNGFVASSVRNESVPSYGSVPGGPIRSIP